MHILASLISLETLSNVLHVVGYPAVALFIFIESAGVPLPGETILLLASFYAGSDSQLQLPIVIVCAACGAILGDNLGYSIGRTGGRKFAERFGRYFFLKTKHLDYAERFFTRHGAKTVFLGRFISILRIWAAFLAGMNKMPWRTFLIYNGTGGVIWALAVGLIGYFAGRLFKDHLNQVVQLVETMSWAGLALVIMIVLIAFILLRVRRARREHAAHIAHSANHPGHGS